VAGGSIKEEEEEGFLERGWVGMNFEFFFLESLNLSKGF
jgi:hypothetical protein